MKLLIFLLPGLLLSAAMFAQSPALPKADSIKPVAGAPIIFKNNNSLYRSYWLNTPQSLSSLAPVSSTNFNLSSGISMKRITPADFQYMQNQILQAPRFSNGLFNNAHSLSAGFSFGKNTGYKIGVTQR